MAQQVIDNGESGLQVRQKLNTMFGDLYGDVDPTLRRIRTTLARSVARQNRLQNRPWTPCPDWQATTVYCTGRRVISSGNEYAAVVAGTSGSVAISGTGLITDGTVTWQYIGPAAYTTAMDGAPTFSTSAAAPALGKFYRNAASTWPSGASIVVSNDNWLKVYGNAAPFDASGIGNFKSRGGAISFWTDAAEICIAAQGGIGTPDYGMYIAVDDRYLTPDLIIDAINNATTYTTIAFTTPGPHKVTLWRHMETGIYIRGVYTDVTGSLWADADPAHELRIGVVLDSYGLYFQYHGANLDRTIAASLGAYLGSDNVFSDPVGGSGYHAGTPYGDAARVAALVAYAPDIVVAPNSVNDQYTASSDLIAGFNAWYAAVRAALPDAYLFVPGTMYHASGETTADSYLRPVVEALDDDRIFWLAASGDPEGPWVNGTGKLSAPTGDGNADIYIAQDNLHPTQRGREYMAYRIRQAILQTINNL